MGYFLQTFSHPRMPNGLQNMGQTCPRAHQDTRTPGGGWGRRRRATTAVFLASPLGSGPTKGAGGSARDGPELLIGCLGAHRVSVSTLSVVVRSLVARRG